jgi:hypothetical protein
MTYHKPEDVTRAGVEVVRVIYDSGADVDESYSVVKLKCGDEVWFGVRWNIRGNERDDPEKQNGKTCNGFPLSSSRPVWFELPEDLILKLFESGSDLRKEFEKVYPHDKGA